MATTRDKIALIERKILAYDNGVYDLELDARAARIVENKDLEERCQKEIAKNLKIKDFLEKELQKEKELLLKEVETNHVEPA